MRLLRISLQVSLLAALIGCDPVHRIVVYNKTKHQAQFIYTTTGTGGRDTTVTKTLEVRGRKSHFNINYGIGLWSIAEVEEVAREYKRVELISVSDTVTLSDPKQILEAFMRGRSGPFKGDIVFNIK